jgi:opacity protein-like surface antigen
MKRSYALLALVAFLFVALPAEEAEAQVSFGPQVVLWDFSELGVGARVDFGLADSFGIDDGFFQDLFGSFNANYVFEGSDNATMLVFNLNGNVPLDLDSDLSPYVGAGLNHWRWSYDAPFTGASSSWSWTGLNILGGLFLDFGNLPAFAELQYSTSGAGFLTLSAGILFGG